MILTDRINKSVFTCSGLGSAWFGENSVRLRIGNTVGFNLNSYNMARIDTETGGVVLAGIFGSDLYPSCKI